MQHMQPQQQAKTMRRKPVTIHITTRPNFPKVSKHASPVYVLFPIVHVASSIPLSVVFTAWFSRLSSWASLKVRKITAHKGAAIANLKSKKFKVINDSLKANWAHLKNIVCLLSMTFPPVLKVKYWFSRRVMHFLPAL